MFEWNEDKNKINFSKHGIWFEEAAMIFEGDIITFSDLRHDYGEDRLISIGSINGIICIVVAHTDRNGKIRIISARRANKKERIRYEQYIKSKA